VLWRHKERERRRRRKRRRSGRACAGG
jgi:hypothetical protein